MKKCKEFLVDIEKIIYLRRELLNYDFPTKC